MAEKKITLKSLDGEIFEVEETMAVESQTIKCMIEDDCTGNGILLPNVTSKILSKVIEYLTSKNRRPRTQDMGCRFHQGQSGYPIRPHSGQIPTPASVSSFFCCRSCLDFAIFFSFIDKLGPGF
ncbi:hypothetical protein COCNU_09G004490 [Cocos nucifera]|uniref:SKP1 component POZ domain-containing protein n=1 Tax=Cocos nucifera TaxID=13894 RepID=A0A8K0IKC5_COCNU|nr:hypothetical protein COCNU_09G004490 [Cocos nucifera]